MAALLDVEYILNLIIQLMLQAKEINLPVIISSVEKHGKGDRSSHIQDQMHPVFLGMKKEVESKGRPHAAPYSTSSSSR